MLVYFISVVSKSMLQLFEALNDLETSLQQLNKSSDILKLNVGSIIAPLTTDIAANTICPSGQVRIEAFCGKYNANGFIGLFFLLLANKRCLNVTLNAFYCPKR